MKKWISVALATFCTVSFVEAMTLEQMDKLVAGANTQALKQVIICEREGNFIYKDSQQCIKAVDMLLVMSKKATKSSLLRCELFGLSEDDCKLMPDVYKKTDKEFFNKYIANLYASAGIIYDENMVYENGVAMYKKAIEYNPNDNIANYNVGIRYRFGQGVAMDKIKAYEHWRIAAKQGHQKAQGNLDILCNESPWVCK
jgi:TPR repeat protein